MDLQETAQSSDQRKQGDVDPPAWAHYVSFDTAALARDLEYDLHVADSADGGVYIFDAGS